MPYSRTNSTKLIQCSYNGRTARDQDGYKSAQTPVHNATDQFIFLCNYSTGWVYHFGYVDGVGSSLSTSARIDTDPENL